MTSCNFKAPNGAESQLYKDLELNYGPDRATQLWQYTFSKDFKDLFEFDVERDINGEPTIMWMTKHVKLPESQVFTRLKAVAILQSEIGQKTFEKGIKNSWSLDKILKELQIPSAQRELILSFELETYDEILQELLLNYSYTVEINTAKGGNTDLTIKETEFKGEKRWSIVDAYTTMPLKSFKTKQEASDYLVNELQKPTSHYSNLTVPGGINYTENEIATPAITPSIKGHAQFATDKGIGWFRSDDKHAFTGFLEDLIASGIIKKVPCG